MGYECFELEEHGGVAHLRMNRPDQLNAMNRAFWVELPELVDELSDSGRVRAMVLSGEGRHFTAGMDLEVFTGSGGLADTEKPTGRRVNARFVHMAKHAQAAFDSLERARFPVLAAVHGACVGGGVDMICASDMRYATNDAWFCIQEINIGMTADVGTLQRMPKLVAEGVVKELAYTGRRMPAAEAAAIGFVNRTFVDRQTMLDEVLDIAGQIATKSPLAIWGTKQTMAYGRDHSVADGLDHIAVWNAAMLDPAEMAEAFTAQAEGREPAFENLPRLDQGL